LQLFPSSISIFVPRFALTVILGKAFGTPLRGGFLEKTGISNTLEIPVPRPSRDPKEERLVN
jgi:hypothetical protein